MKQSPLLWTLPEFLYTFIHAHLIPPATEYFLFSTINIILWRCNYFHFCTAYAFAKLILCSVHFGFIFLYSKVLTTSKVRYKKISCCFGIGVLVVLLWATLEAYCSDWNTRFYGTTSQNDIPVYEASELDSIFRPRRKHSVWTRQETWQQLQRTQKRSEAYLLNLQKGPGMRSGKGRGFCYSDPMIHWLGGQWRRGHPFFCQYL